MLTSTPRANSACVVLSGILLWFAAGGCQNPPAVQGPSTASAATQPSEQAAVTQGKGGAQLWAENCNRCHNMRDPASYNAGQWIVSMHQMRVRANLTAEEHRLILGFLLASSK